jgi:HEAT repeat protein
MVETITISAIVASIIGSTVFEVAKRSVDSGLREARDPEELLSYAIIEAIDHSAVCLEKLGEVGSQIKSYEIKTFGDLRRLLLRNGAGRSQVAKYISSLKAYIAYRHPDLSGSIQLDSTEELISAVNRLVGNPVVLYPIYRAYNASKVMETWQYSDFFGLNIDPSSNLESSYYPPRFRKLFLEETESTAISGVAEDPSKRAKPRKEVANLFNWMSSYYKPGNKIAVLGASGQGKTAFLHYLFYKTLRGEIPGFEHFIPIAINLKNLENGTPWKWAVEQDQTGFLASLGASASTSSPCLFLFDGLDETGSIGTVLKAIENFHCHQESILIISSRPTAFFDRYPVQGYNQIFNIADFQGDDASSFVEQLSSHFSREKRDLLRRFSNSIPELIKNSPNRQFVFSNPLFLLMGMRIWLDSPFPEHFPSQRIDICKKFVDELARWTRERELSRKGRAAVLDDEIVDSHRRFLRRLSILMLLENQRVVSIDFLKEKRNHLGEIPAGILSKTDMFGMLLRHGDKFTFWQQTFSDFFAAEGIIEDQEALEKFIEVERPFVVSDRGELPFHDIWPSRAHAALLMAPALLQEKDEESAQELLWRLFEIDWKHALAACAQGVEPEGDMLEKLAACASYHYYPLGDLARHSISRIDALREFVDSVRQAPYRLKGMIINGVIEEIEKPEYPEPYKWAFLIGDFADDRAVAPLIDILEKADTENMVKEGIIYSLLNIGTKESVEYALAYVLADPDSRGLSVPSSLRNSKDHYFYKTIENLLACGDEQKRIAAVKALVSDNIGMGMQLLCKALKDTSDKVVEIASVGIALNFSEFVIDESATEMVGEILFWLKGNDKVAKQTKIEIYSHDDGKDGEDFILSCLADSDQRVRLSALRALKLRPTPRAENIILDRLNDEDAMTRISAIDALGECGSKESIGILETILGSGNRADRIHAMDSIAQIKHENAVEILDRYIDDEELYFQVRAILARLRSPRIFERLVERLNGSPDEYKSVVYALRILKDPRSVGPLLEALNTLMNWKPDEDISFDGITASNTVDDIFLALETLGSREAEAAAFELLMQTTNSKRIRDHARSLLMAIYQKNSLDFNMLKNQIVKAIERRAQERDGLIDKFVAYLELKITTN